MEYGRILKEKREEKNLSQQDVANYLNIARQTYNHYEVQENIIPTKHLYNLSNYFEVSIDYLLGLTAVNDFIYKKDLDLKLAGQRLKEWRRKNKITQGKLAEQLNTTFSTIAWYEKGRNVIATSFLYYICNKYHVSADYLLGKIDVDILK